MAELGPDSVRFEADVERCAGHHAQADVLDACAAAWEADREELSLIKKHWSSPADVEHLYERIRELEQHRDCLLRGIREWDLADAPNEMVAAFLEAAARGEFLAP